MTGLPGGLEGELAVVTGAARGLGRAIADLLRDSGARVVSVDLPGTLPEDDPAAYGFDLADTEALPGLIDTVRAEHGPVSILVNNAGVAALQHFNEITVADWRRVMRVNCDAPFFLAQRAAEHMIADRIPGRIVMISSKNGLMAEAGLAHYNASKGALELVTKSLAAELGPHGITVNAVAPGMIATPIDGDFPFDREAFEAAWTARIPLRGGYGTPADVAAAVLYLVSPQARYVTGSTLVVDGGVLADQMPRLRFMPPYRNTVR
ncbi:SDR family NAD(P)-dependent oxidoreductase [Nonomuraea sp. NPDC050310]|uniref:SDR family NAD(P)-dependent oxidoreductase n=1 Tax=unclassified Nonomuraea TaxID=2593643 RepID=UPI0033F94BEB